MPKKPIRLGIVGVGKFARDHHIPSILANPDFRLTAACSRHAEVQGVPNFKSIQDMISQTEALDAVSICAPPQVHYEMAKFALNHGRHVLLEKPPCTSLAQLGHLIGVARTRGCSLYQIWHSQHAPGVAPIRELLRQRTLQRARVTWKEDVRIWHPGQAWIWQSGGFGVFDAGINALSILTQLIEEAIFPAAATLYVPSNCETPIAANAVLQTASGVEIQVELDFRHAGIQTWDIDFHTDEGPLKLSAGGGHLTVGGSRLPHDPEKLRSEYVSVYEHFAQLVAQRRTEVDVRPLELVADIFLIGKRVNVAPFAASSP